MEDYIKKVKRYTEVMPPNNPWYFNETRRKSLACETGYAEAVGVYSDINGSVAKVTFQPGTRTPKESHEQVETYHVLTGSLTIYTWEQRSKKVVTLEQHGVYELKPWIRHVITADSKTVTIVVTMPFSPNLPLANGEENTKHATGSIRME